jgi:hypothetical protein
MDYDRQGLDRKGILVDTSEFDPKDYFQLFFPDAVFKLLAETTNVYAMKFSDTSDDDLNTHSRFHNFTDRNISEMKKICSIADINGTCF